MAPLYWGFVGESAVDSNNIELCLSSSSSSSSSSSFSMCYCHCLVSGMTQPSSAQTNAPVAEAIDDCGLRFLLASRHHVYLLNTLPLRQRAQMQQFGLSPAYYVWAFHSESQDELLNSLPSMQKGAPTWAEMRQFGVGWWLRNINSLQRCAEKVGQPFHLIIRSLSIVMWYLDVYMTWCHLE